MTREKWSTMTDDEQLTKVAELCGWTDVDKRPHVSAYRLTGRHPRQGDSRLCKIPDYLHDLNAMSEAERLLSKRQRVDFIFNLNCEVLDMQIPIVSKGTDWTTDQIFESVSATAAQRAEAFALTMGGEDDDHR